MSDQPRGTMVPLFARFHPTQGLPGDTPERVTGQDRTDPPPDSSRPSFWRT